MTKEIEISKKENYEPMIFDDALNLVKEMFGKVQADRAGHKRLEEAEALLEKAVEIAKEHQVKTLVDKT